MFLAYSDKDSVLETPPPPTPSVATFHPKRRGGGSGNLPTSRFSHHDICQRLPRPSVPHPHHFIYPTLLIPSHPPHSSVLSTRGHHRTATDRSPRTLPCRQIRICSPLLPVGTYFVWSRSQSSDRRPYRSRRSLRFLRCQSTLLLIPQSRFHLHSRSLSSSIPGARAVKDRTLPERSAIPSSTRAPIFRSHASDRFGVRRPIGSAR